MEGVADVWPVEEQVIFVNSFDILEFAGGDLEKFGIVDFRGVFAGECAVEDQTGGVTFFVEVRLELGSTVPSQIRDQTLTGHGELRRWIRLMPCSSLS